MKTSEVVTTTTIYTSDVVPAIHGDHVRDGQLITWADANPIVWKIVMGTRSKAWGKGSSHYLGSDRSDAPSAVLHRVAVFKQYFTMGRASEQHGVFVDKPFNENIFQFSARFTLEHYNDKGFKGGFFQQFDGTYDRGCMTLDYTPGTLDGVVERFRAWCDAGLCRYETTAIKLDKRVIRTIKITVNKIKEG